MWSYTKLLWNNKGTLLNLNTHMPDFSLILYKCGSRYTHILLAQLWTSSRVCVECGYIMWKDSFYLALQHQFVKKCTLHKTKASNNFRSQMDFDLTQKKKWCCTAKTVSPPSQATSQPSTFINKFTYSPFIDERWKKSPLFILERSYCLLLFFFF